MANFNIPEAPEFTDEIRMFEVTDPGHADIFNQVTGALLQNEVFLNKSKLDTNGDAANTTVTFSEAGELKPMKSKAKMSELIGVAAKAASVLIGHISDTAKHITSTERTNWNDANTKKHSHENKSVLDGITSSLVTNWNSAVSHISDTAKHITSVERTNWNDANTKKHSHENKTVLDGLATGTCSTAQGTPAKVVSCPGFVLQDGARVMVTFANGNTSNYMTINVNNTGAYVAWFPIDGVRSYNNEKISKYIVAGCAYEFIFQQGSPAKWVYCGINHQNSDADTLDGKHASNFLAVSSVTTETNFDNVKTPGVYRLQASCTGLPMTNWGTVYVDGTSASVYQIYIPDSKTMSLYKRGWLGGSGAWSEWEQLNPSDFASKEIYGDTVVSMGRKSGTVVGEKSFAFGLEVTASGNHSHAEGFYAKAFGDHSHAEGFETNASGDNSHAEGASTVASANGSHAEGSSTKALGYVSHAEGFYTTAGNYASHASGKYNKEMTTDDASNTQIGDVFVVGNGTSSTDRSNAMRITYAGDIYGTKAFQSSGADYAEFIKPWADGNTDGEDRVGYFVTIKNGLLYKAEPGDYVAGITSGNPSVVGNADEDYYWRYERDIFNRIVLEDVPETVQETDDDGNLLFDEETHEPILVETGEMIPNACMKLSESYDPSLQNDYVPRKDRREWDYVGMTGIIPVRDDGTCLPDHFCRCGDGGIATLSDKRSFDTFYVIERLSDHVVSVELR